MDIYGPRNGVRCICGMSEAINGIFCKLSNNDWKSERRVVEEGTVVLPISLVAVAMMSNALAVGPESEGD